ncbi:cytochrome-c peroxidase [Dyadobacter sp. CY356]|uniref:cytochrome-c peroxidase n=1 Tax=Dyadobacter sp. CY356 TaxID=2906442 RepID=UPI001F2DA407|nr:cytochrome c peroxidase [Dyadobacter sp. CY356]MCF0057046.1 cytochrome C peroxidase [Dyadobacter sp. CY356]
MERAFKIFIVFGSLACIFMTASFRKKKETGIPKVLQQFRTDSKSFAASISTLDSALQEINSARPQTITSAKKALIRSRVAYKRVEYFLEYFFYTSSRIYNRAPKNEIEEPYLEYQELAGLQYIETMLFDSLPEGHKSEFTEQTKLISLSANDLNALLHEFGGTDTQILEAVRTEFVRVATLGITGFDAPMLKSGIEESLSALESSRKILIPYLEKYNSDVSDLKLYLDRSILYLKQNPDFDTFDRLEFLTTCLFPLQNRFEKWIKTAGLEPDKKGVLNYKAENIFSRNALNEEAFMTEKHNTSRAKITLGKKLFSETLLSGNAQKSCASCHNPQNYFMDGLLKSIGLTSERFAKRNAPSLLYSKYQHSQFWDGRVKSLEDQIENVIQDTLEMNGNIEAILTKLNAEKQYRKSFQKAFFKKQDDIITDKELYRTIASYVRTLNPYNSPFDQYMRGNRNALTENQISGFNLFMGKAQCATCHFAPLFNGLIPPLYKLTEFEILGTTKTDNLEKPENDPDEGRFNFRPIKFYKGAFKTPTVRNAAKTAPYMHNGAFQSLETLIEFYNQGGGAGMGLSVPSQTLSSAKLNLSEKEKNDIIAFLNALTDDLSDI